MLFTDGLSSCNNDGMIVWVVAIKKTTKTLSKRSTSQKWIKFNHSLSNKKSRLVLIILWIIQTCIHIVTGVLFSPPQIYVAFNILRAFKETMVPFISLVTFAFWKKKYKSNIKSCKWNKSSLKIMECIIHISKSEQHTDQNTIMKATGEICCSNNNQHPVFKFIHEIVN